MKNNIYKALGMGAILMAFPSLGFAHGYVDSPGARNYFCGAVTKPDQVANGTAQYPVCGDAFANDFNGGYSYMSVLNHHGGRMERSSTNVCGFDSETWQGGKTPWDNAINWPVNNINGGQITFNWDISNGPHFDDTSDFRYWITKPSFQYQVGKELTWNDFEAQPFCNLAYNDDNPSAYPMVKPNRANAHFATTCTLPARTGRHVIYAEWGREPPTLERFHGCIDVQIGGGGASSVAPSSAAVSSVRSSTPASIAASSRASTPSSTASGQQCNWYGQLYPVCTTQSAEWGYENNQSCIGSVKCNSQTGGGGVVGGSSTATTPSSTPRSSVAPSSTPRSSVTPSSVAASVRSSLAPSSVPASSVASGATCNWYGWMVAICKNTTSGWGNENNQTCISQSACNAR